MKWGGGNGYQLGARDEYTVTCLRRNGFNNVIMTGCTAWYKIEKIGCGLKRHSLNDIEKICISDPEQSVNYDMAFTVVEYLKKFFMQAKLVYVFHRGISADMYVTKETGAKREKFCEKLKALNVQFIDISDSDEGFAVYDDCHLHVGFRVHAHLYNLSNRTPSILLEEDGRGTAANFALGLPSIPCYNTNQVLFNRIFLQKVSDKLFRPENEYLILQLEDWLMALEAENLQQMEWVFQRMEYYFLQMEKHISSLN